MKLQPELFNSILVIRLSSLGDVILTTPILRAIKKKYPAANIDFVVKEQYRMVVENNPYLRKVFPLFYNKKNFKELRKELKKNNYDLVLDLQNNFRSRRLTSYTKAKVFRFNKLSLEKFLLVQFKINKLKNKGLITERYAEAFPDLELDNDGAEIFIPGNIKPRINGDKKYIGFCPGSRHATKIWSSGYFIELGNKLAEEGYTILLFGGKEDEHLCISLQHHIKDSIDLSTNNNLYQMASEMTFCSVIVSNDSGLMHAASAMKVPIVTIFGSSVKEFGFTPYKSNFILVENNNISCRPCSHIGRDKCPQGHFNCLEEITPQMVYDSIKKIIGA